MTISSFGQTIIIELGCSASGSSIATLKFEAPVNGVYPGAVFIEGVTEPIETGYTLFYESTDDTWVVNHPDPYRFFYTTDSPAALTPCTATWVPDSDAGGGANPCDSVNIISCLVQPPEEVCDGIDNDGDGDIDEDLPVTTYYIDDDEDGYGSILDSIGEEFCSDPGVGYSLTNDDCDDLQSDIYLNAPEICDGLDNDCDGEIDEDIPDCNNGVILEYCNDAKTKILVCHNGKDICVSINALAAHEAHGDYLGSCANVREGEVLAEEVPASYDVVSWPNPSNDNFNIKMITPNIVDKVSIEAFDINGRLVHSNTIDGNEDYQFGGKLSSGVYFVRLSQASRTEVVRIIKQ
ncbi:MAG: T9SS type A sorting domain-containing protein [Flavobacteriaceae bacterium]|nr:T9SS type A sorting domain-containing protein [Bacteroidia bacterium]NNL16100.1 T9SS type A sorting domain-containing protein [Flavobacteriaceae bacterium]